MKRSILSGLVVVGMLFFTGCSDKSDTKMLNGRVIDHYVQGATISSGGSTATSGKYGEFTIRDTGEPLTAEGGVDIATGEKFLGKLKAPAGSKIINSLTNEVQALIESKGKSITDAKQEIKSKFDLPDVDVTEYDPIKQLVEKADDATAKKTLARQAQVQAVLNATAKALEEHVNVDAKKAFEEASKVILENINKPDDITPATIGEIITETAQNIGVTDDTMTEEVDDIAQKIVDALGVIEEAISENTNAEELIKITEAAIKTVEKVAENPESVEDVESAIETEKEDVNITLPPKEIYEEVTTGAEG